MIEFLACDLRAAVIAARMPFRYGIATMTRVPHLFVTVHARIDGRPATGVSADVLPPKWFTKNPESSYHDDLADMARVIEHAAESAADADTVFEFWRQLYQAQSRWAADESIPPLLANFGVSLVERAMIDAWCRSTDTTFARTVRDNTLGIDLGAVHPELAGAAPADLLPESPRTRIDLRHTVGLADPLTDAEIPGNERCGDGLPQSLEAALAVYRLRRLKIKVSGDVEADLARLRAIAALATAAAPDHTFTLDGNEQYGSVEEFRELWSAVAADPVLAEWRQRLLFVEQPIHRDHALSPAVADALAAWADAPPMIIDESGGAVGDLPRALDCGYRGASHKNCKGVVKGVADACLLEHRRRHDDGPLVQSAEDLCNIGPVALLQDLAVVATLGIGHVERNGHHYFAGMSVWPADVGDCLTRCHGDLYRRRESGLVALDVVDGRLRLDSVIAAPFGSRCAAIASALPPLTEVLDEFGATADR